MNASASASVSIGASGSVRVSESASGSGSASVSAGADVSASASVSLRASVGAASVSVSISSASASDSPCRAHHSMIAIQCSPFNIESCCCCVCTHQSGHHFGRGSAEGLVPPLHNTRTFGAPSVDHELCVSCWAGYYARLIVEQTTTTHCGGSRR